MIFGERRRRPRDARSSRSVSRSVPSASTEPLATQAPAVARNVLSGYVPILAFALSGLVLTPLLIKALGPTEYGVWAIALGVLGFFGLLDAGIGTAVVTRVAHSLPDDRGVGSVTRTASAIYVGLAALLVAIAVPLAWSAPSLFHADGHEGAARLTFLVLAVGQVAALMLCVPAGALQGAGYFGLSARRGALITIATSASQAAAAILTHNLAIVALVTALSGFGTLAYVHRLAWRRVPGYTLSPRRPSPTVARGLVKLGSRNAIIFVAGAVGYGSDVVIVGIIVGARGAATYAIASRAAGFSRTLATRVADALSGSYATLSARNETRRAWGLYLRAVSVSLTILLPLAFVLVAFGRSLLEDWVGGSGRAAYPILVVLATMSVVQLAGHHAFILITGLEKSHLLTRISVVSAVLNLVLSVLLTVMLGPIGVAYGSLITALLIDLVILPRIAAKACATSAGELVGPFRRLWLPLVLQVAAYAVLVGLHQNHGYQAVAGAAVSVAIFFGGCLVVADMRSEIGHTASALWNRSARRRG